ncbi:MAG: biotin--[acetyl-CoA-carboxylase] ligase [Alphaproteobacteria bacterium]|nr:biotin--[acetyl-CoA-carboxylase] ligase [Alphaproteobacteria bacterium]
MTDLALSTILKVVDILSDCKIHTGTHIATTLGISRTAVWKVIQRLKNYNIDVYSHHKGYQIQFPLVLLDKKRIEDLVNDSRIKVEIIESLPSTNDYLRNKTPFENLHFCLAEHQSKGRGRLGRSWSSPFGHNIYCSFSYSFNKDISELSGLSLIVGILVVRALESLFPTLKPLLKWPNDIYLNDKKMGGILIDIISEAHGNSKAVIGMGMNVNMKDVDLNEVDQPWTSLEDILNAKTDRNIVVVQIIRSILQGLDVFLEAGMEPILSAWSWYDLLEGKQISINTSGEITTGTSRGITKQGYLLLELSSGEVKAFSCGDTSLLKN